MKVRFCKCSQFYFFAGSSEFFSSFFYKAILLMINDVWVAPKLQKVDVSSLSE
jgi:hypothetical protein